MIGFAVDTPTACLAGTGAERGIPLRQAHQFAIEPTSPSAPSLLEVDRTHPDTGKSRGGVIVGRIVRHTIIARLKARIEAASAGLTS
jgi:hypothetical protein